MILTGFTLFNIIRAVGSLLLRDHGGSKPRETPTASVIHRAIQQPLQPGPVISQQALEASACLGAVLIPHGEERWVEDQDDDVILLHGLDALHLALGACIGCTGCVRVGLFLVG